MRKLLLNIMIAFYSSLCLLSCSNEKSQKLEEGIYGLRTYFCKEDFNSEYMDYFLMEVTKDKVIYFGTVNTWGSVTNRESIDEKKLIINDSLIYHPFTGQIYIKLEEADDIITKDGINREAFSKYLNQKLIAGKYRIENKIIEFTSNGEVLNLDSIQKYSVLPRFGTCWWYGYRTIKLNNDYYDFKIRQRELILKKYLKPKIEELVELSDTILYFEKL